MLIDVHGVIHIRSDFQRHRTIMDDFLIRSRHTLDLTKSLLFSTNLKEKRLQDEETQNRELDKYDQSVKQFWNDIAQELADTPLTSALRGLVFFKFRVLHSITDDTPLEKLEEYGTEILNQVSRLM